MNIPYGALIMEQGCAIHIVLPSQEKKLRKCSKNTMCKPKKQKQKQNINVYTLPHI